MEQKLISIALCTYNGEKHLAEQLDSIVNQTYKKLEIVIVDDCSTDNSYNIALGYAENDKRIRCFRNKTNLGFNKNFENALNLTTGDYIAISDQDDIWMDTKIYELLNNIGDNWLVFSNSVYIEDDGTVTDKPLLLNFKYLQRNYMAFLLGNFVTGHTTLMAREFLEHIFPFPENGYYDWWMGFVASYNHKLKYVDKVLTQYRIHEKSVIQQSLAADAEKQKKLYFALNSTMQSNYLTYKGLNNSDKKFILNLKKAYHQVNYPYYNLKLIHLLYSQYLNLFPYLKKRKGISRLLFVLKYARRVKE